MNFDQRIEKYFSNVRGDIEPGVWRIQKLLGNLLFDLDTLPTFLVSGTNGKGTVCRILETVFLKLGRGVKTGVYASPHLVSGCERLRINGLPSEPSLLSAGLDFVESRLHLLPNATFFEISTAAAFWAAMREKVDVFICEVGLGGRLDSTNCLLPDVSVLVSVGLDHCEILGNSKKLISYEKTFIGRKNKPLVLGEICKESEDGVVLANHKVCADLVKKKSFNTNDVFPSHLKFLENSLQISLTALNEFNNRTNKNRKKSIEFLEDFDCTSENLKPIFENFVWPGRMDLRMSGGFYYLIDGAHNEHGMKYFVSALKNFMNYFETVCFVFASFTDKNYADSIKILRTLNSPIVFTSTQSSRSVSVEMFNLEEGDFCKPSVCEALEYAQTLVQERAKVSESKKHLIACVGSLTLAGKTFECLNLAPFDFGSSVFL
jgi:dihydrofolate synthase / folylpolyglutamate synthase